MRWKEKPVLDDSGSPIPEWQRYWKWHAHWAQKGDPEDLKLVYRWRRWRKAVQEWGQRNGFDPDASYFTPEGKRWHEFFGERMKEQRAKLAQGNPPS